MAQGSRPDRVAEEVRHVLSDALARDVKDPGLGFVTVTRVTVSPDLQLARVYYSIIGDEKARKNSKAALERCTPFLRRRLGQEIRLRRVPELHFHYDEGIAHQARVEELIYEIQQERAAREAAEAAAPAPDGDDAAKKDPAE